MELTQEVLGNILAKIFNIDRKFVTIKQGNWFNPQTSPYIENKPLTWVRYRITEDIPVSSPGVSEDEDESGNSFQTIETQMETDIEMDFIGTRAEECANSVKNWNLRADVVEQLETVRATLMLTKRRSRTFNYTQEGMNGQLAYNANFKVARTSVAPTGAEKLSDIDTIIIDGGGLNV